MLLRPFPCSMSAGICASGFSVPALAAGLDDARNTARLAMHYMQQGAVIDVTGAFEDCTLPGMSGRQGVLFPLRSAAMVGLHAVLRKVQCKSTSTPQLWRASYHSTNGSQARGPHCPSTHEASFN